MQAKRSLKTKRTIVCTGCGDIFKGIRPTRRFCSQSCADKYRHKNSYIKRKEIVGRWVECTLKSCKGKVWLYPRDIKKGRKAYCGFSCFGKGKTTSLLLTCSECPIQFYCTPSQVRLRHRVTCSMKCRGTKMSRLAEERIKNNPPTQGVINRRLRYSKKMDEWRKAVFERDNYTCQHCHVRGGYIQADHIKPFAYFPELRFDLNNGRTLCKPCHVKTDTYGGRVKKLYATQQTA
jgi:hypothetical protein